MRYFSCICEKLVEFGCDLLFWGRVFIEHALTPAVVSDWRVDVVNVLATLLHTLNLTWGNLLIFCSLSGLPVDNMARTPSTKPSNSPSTTNIGFYHWENFSLSKYRRLRQWPSANSNFCGKIKIMNRCTWQVSDCTFYPSTHPREDRNIMDR